jgi:hypothetical protein
MGSVRPVREAPVSIAHVPRPWRVTRVRLSEAARLAGVSRSSLHRVLKDEKGQSWIDASEIARAYPDTFRSVPWNPPGDTVEQLVETVLERELRVRLADKDAVIADLRRRRDAEAEERRQLLAVLRGSLRLLEHHAQAAVSAEPRPDPPADAADHSAGERRAPWWRRWWR